MQGPRGFSKAPSPPSDSNLSHHSCPHPRHGTVPGGSAAGGQQPRRRPRNGRLRPRLTGCPFPAPGPAWPVCPDDDRGLWASAGGPRTEVPTQHPAKSVPPCQHAARGPDEFLARSPDRVALSAGRRLRRPAGRAALCTPRTERVAWRRCLPAGCLVLSGTPDGTGR